MAFTGVPVVKRVSDSLIRITGISLDAGAVGTISLDAGAGEIKLPADFQPTVYAGQGNSGPVTLQDSIELSHLPCVPVQVVKTGTTKQNWLATLTNLHTAGGGEAQSAMFYGTAGEGDYPSPIAAGAAVPFPTAGPNVGGGIVAGGLNQFVLPADGTYRVSWSVCFTGPSQLQVALNEVPVVGTVNLSGGPLVASGYQNDNTVLVTGLAGDLLSIINPDPNGPATIQSEDGTLESAPNPALVVELVTGGSEPAATGALEIYVRHH